MANWYGIYDDTSKDVTSAGFFAEPESVDCGAGKSLSAEQVGDIPTDLFQEDGTTPNYAYNTGNSLIEAK